FSSRRRHTRFSRDWSSDVCSSDLVGGRARIGERLKVGRLKLDRLAATTGRRLIGVVEGEPGAQGRALEVHLRAKKEQCSFRCHRSEERRVGKECRSRWSPCQ